MKSIYNIAGKWASVPAKATPFWIFWNRPCRSLSPTQNPMKLYTDFTAPQDKSESS